MRGTTAILTVLLSFGIAMATPDWAPAQGRGGQQQRMQDRIHRTDEQLQRLDRMQERMRQMDQDMTRDMDRIRDRLHSQDAQLREQDRLRDQDQLRQQERLHAMAGSMGQMAQHMRQALQQVRAMEGDPNFEGNQVMQQETERLREHLQKMNDDLEEGIRMMEQIHQRVRQDQPQE